MFAKLLENINDSLYEIIDIITDVNIQYAHLYGVFNILYWYLSTETISINFVI